MPCRKGLRSVVHATKESHLRCRFTPYAVVLPCSRGAHGSAHGRDGRGDINMQQGWGVGFAICEIPRGGWPQAMLTALIILGSAWCYRTPCALPPKTIHKYSPAHETTNAVCLEILSDRWPVVSNCPWGRMVAAAYPVCIVVLLINRNTQPRV